MPWGCAVGGCREGLGAQGQEEVVRAAAGGSGIGYLMVYIGSSNSRGWCIGQRVHGTQIQMGMAGRQVASQGHFKGLQRWLGLEMIINAALWGAWRVPSTSLTHQRSEVATHHT